LILSSQYLFLNRSGFANIMNIFSLLAKDYPLTERRKFIYSRRVKLRKKIVLKTEKEIMQCLVPGIFFENQMEIFFLTKINLWESLIYAE